MLQDSGGYETALDPWIDNLFVALPSVFPRAVASRPTTAPAETPKMYVRACQPSTMDTSGTPVATNSEGASAERAEPEKEHFRAACRAAAAYRDLAGIASGAKPWGASPLLDTAPVSDKARISPPTGGHGSSSCTSRSFANPFWAAVVKSDRLTAADHWQVCCCTRTASTN